MKRILLMIIEGIYYRVFRQIWIVSPVGETCSPVPVYLVEDARVKVTHRGVSVVKDHNDQ